MTPAQQDFLKAEEGQEIYQSGWDAMEEYVLSGGFNDYPVNPHLVGSTQHHAFNKGGEDWVSRWYSYP